MLMNDVSLERNTLNEVSAVQFVPGEQSSMCRKVLEMIDDKVVSEFNKPFPRPGRVAPFQKGKFVHIQHILTFYLLNESLVTACFHLQFEIPSIRFNSCLKNKLFRSFYITHNIALERLKTIEKHNEELMKSLLTCEGTIKSQIVHQMVKTDAQHRKSAAVFYVKNQRKLQQIDEQNEKLYSRLKAQ